MDLDTVPAGDPQQSADSLVEVFERRYDAVPQAVHAAPGRVNLIGEHVDYNGGHCLPMAIPHATYAAVARRDDDVVRVTSRQQDEPWTGRLGALGPGQVEGWVTYVAGVVWALTGPLRERGIDVPGVDIAVDGHVPLGGGLSSSAALECSVALGLCHAVGLEADEVLRKELVQACIRAEAEVAGAPTGGMDQTIALLGRQGHALLLDCQDWSTRQVRWDPAAAGVSLLVVDTRATHQLGDGGYAARRADCEAAAAELGVATLREVADSETPEDAWARLDDPRLRRRTRHVLTEMARVAEAVAQIEAGDLAGLGRTFDASHASLRDDFEVSCDELDVAVVASREAGALGGRMTGGGFGGSAIALVPDDRLEDVTVAVGEEFARRSFTPPRFLVAQPSAGARRVR